MKTCPKCQQAKPLDEFHRQGEGRRHSYCRSCFNALQRGRNRDIDPKVRARHNLKTRYGLSPADVEAMLQAQGGVCAICGGPPVPQRIDHDHVTGRVRGVLCHRCNIWLAVVEDDKFMDAALQYLGRVHA